MVGKSENILVEFDYNNITIIDPNKVIDGDNKVKDRFVSQENLVMYANLECSVLPRTKLAIGTANNDSIRTVSIAKINFLKPGDKPYLDNSYTDELTGKNAIKGEGVNQPTLNSVTNPNNSDDFYIKQTISSGGKPGATDNGLLGITSISIRQGLDFLPTIDIRLVDVKGRALFEAGDNSPYAAFFNLPYPLFHLTIKGYFGKAVRLALMLQNFTTTYNADTANFTVDLKFYTYKYTVLTDVTMGALLATPHMYQSRFNISKTSGGPSTTTKTESVVIERGYQKVREMYSEYKSKGLIPDDFPEITLMQMKDRIDNFIKNVLDSFSKQNLDPLTNLDAYGVHLLDYQKEIFYNVKTSWFNEFMDTENCYIKNKTGQKIYTFKKDLDAQKKSDAISKLKGLVEKYNKLLNENVTCGSNGSYTISGKITKCSIPNDVKYERKGVFIIDINSSDIDLTETYKLQRKNSQPTPEDLTKFQAELDNLKLFNNTSITLKNGSKQIISQYFVFEGSGSFIDLTDKMGKDLKTKRGVIEDELTKALASLLENKDNGIGFVPTIRNVLAVVFANGEAFLRLMDDVHTKAWEQRDNKIRKGVIFDKQIANASADNKSSGDDKNQPVYPWPQVIKETTGENGQEKYELRYPGDSDIIGETKGYLYDVWPEIEFVEEFISGMTQKTPPPPPPTKTSNPTKEPNRVSLGAIEFPINNEVYENKVASKFIYEIYERTLLTSHYSKLDRSNNLKSEADKISNVVSEGETINVTQSLSDNSDVELIKTLKEYNLNASNFENVLKHISNEGVSASWQNYIRGVFNTGYIKNTVENASFEFITYGVIDDSKSQPLVSLNNENDIINYVSTSTTSNKYDFADIYPFTDKKWVQNNLANGKSTDETLAFNTTKTLLYNPNKKVISNFSDVQSENDKKPITNFVYKNIVTPVIGDDLRNFYSTRTYTNQLPTEGDIKYLNYSGLVSSYQTTSIFNTPYFINAIQEGVEYFKDGNTNPYISSAYLFINSLPLSTLKEKYKTYTGNEANYSDENLDYIFASLKKYAAVHKMPYAWILKIGSIWHRYKNYINYNTDILNNTWKNFDAKKNYDPVNNSESTVYNFTIPGQVSATTMVLETTNVIPSFPLGTNVNETIINTGFYPKLINDFNVFYQGYEVYSGYTSSDIQSGFNDGVKLSYVPEAVINNISNDTSGNTKTISVIPWSVSINADYGQYTYIVPSHGSLINQTQNECFDTSGNMVYQVTGNTSMYNGSVRLFWTSPNYGYYDNSKVVKPQPIHYLKQIFSGQSSQENFSINGILSDYSKMNEIFSIFDRDTLDKFETKFLDFTISIYDYEVDEDSTDTETQKSFKNFQSLMRNMMKIANTSPTEELSVKDIQQKQLTNISNILSEFLNYDVYFKIGNPSSFDKQLFYTFSSNHRIETPVTWDYYKYVTPNSLPNQTTLINSRTLYPLEWKALETYIGFSDITELTYKDGGSYITDFFIDCNVAFDVYNIEKLAPIIKIYATQKLKDNTLNYDKFVKLMDGYLDNLDSFTNRVINNTMIKLQKSLPNVNFTPQVKPETVLESKQTKLELWESFKATNDKWISGMDLKEKTLFEDVLLLDRASRDVGDKILVDVQKLKTDLTDINVASTMFTYVQTILVRNNFVVMNIPSYVNFYNVQDAVKNPKPKPEGTLEFANTMFGTFMDVDYRNSSAKMVCFYAGKPSEQLDLKENVDYRYRNDAFDLRRVDNPLVENQIGKNDWDKSNKVVGFNVDFGPQNQSIFQGFNVTQNPGLATAESLEVLNKMANQSNNRGGATQSNSLYNLYKNRSYSCTVTMMGNAMIQPTMYFNLRHVPMFSGPYMIQKVNHTITPGHFETIFEGIRQPTASLPKVDNYIQSLKTTLLQSIIDKNKTDRQEKEKNVKAGVPTNALTQVDKKVSENISQDGTTQSNSQNCQPLAGKYDKFTVIDTVLNGSATYKEVVDLISVKTTDQKVRYAVFAKMYLSSSQSGMLQSKSFNYSNTDLKENWGPSIEKFFTTKKYYCSNKNEPYVTFTDLTQNVEFLISRFNGRVGKINGITSKDIAKFLILDADAAISADSIYTSMSSTDVTTIEDNVQNSINVFNTVTGNFTNTPSPANVPAPPSYLKIVNLGVFSDVQGDDYSYRNILQSNGKYIVLKIEDPNFTFDKLGLTTFLNANNESIGYGCNGGSGALTCTVNGKSPGLYTMVQEYYPYKPQNWDKFEIRSVPFNQ